MAKKKIEHTPPQKHELNCETPDSPALATPVADEIIQLQLQVGELLRAFEMLAQQQSQLVEKLPQPLPGELLVGVKPSDVFNTALSTALKSLLGNHANINVLRKRGAKDLSQQIQLAIEFAKTTHLLALDIFNGENIADSEGARTQSTLEAKTRRHLETVPA